MTIEEAIARISSWQKASSLAITPLPGGITNFNYRVDVDREPFHVRIWAKQAELLGIDREREYHCMVAASRTGAAPEVVHFLPEAGVMVTRFIAGRSLSQEEMARPETVRRVVESMHRYHRGPAFEGAYSPFRTIEAYLRVARQHGAPLPGDIEKVSWRMPEIEAALARGPIVGPCHNDLWGPNLIDDGSRVRIVDWEYAGMGDIHFDLANFAIYHSPSDDEDTALLQAYFGTTSDPAFARLKLLRIVAQLREALWYLAALTVAGDTAGFVEQAAAHFDRYRQAVTDPRLPSWLSQAASIASSD